jgi:hypothetical protein
MVSNSVDVSLLTLRQEERRVKVDHDDSVILALATSDPVQDFIWNVPGDIVEVTSVRVGKNHGASRQVAVKSILVSV